MKRIGIGLGDWIGDHHIAGKTGAKPGDPLSTRQAQCAKLAVQGFTTTQIAGLVKLSAHTVKDHIRAAYVKTGSSSRAELATWAAQYGQREDGPAPTVPDDHILADMLAQAGLQPGETLHRGNVQVLRGFVALVLADARRAAP